MRTNVETPPLHPGGVLNEKDLVPLGIAQHRLAVAIGVPPRRINEIVHGKGRISPDTAVRLTRHFGTLERFWMNGKAAMTLSLNATGWVPSSTKSDSSCERDSI